jgi:hypothetical protein
VSAQAAWILEDPRVVGWMQDVKLHAMFGFAPDDPDERVFLLAMIDDE